MALCYNEVFAVPGEPFLQPSSTTYNAAHHRFAVFLVCATFLLIVAGALVTSNDAGLSVPDWPTTFGSLYRIPPMVGGVKFEHGHRMVAEFVGLLCIVLAVWTWRVERRRWMRALGFIILGSVIAQGILGGITVLKLLPWTVSTAHASLAQAIFSAVVALALVTSRSWLDDQTPRAPDRFRPATLTLAALSVVAVYVQLILGAGFRHSGIKLLPHLICAALVTVLVLWTSLRVISRFSELRMMRRTAQSLLGLLVLQLCLGFGSYLTRVQWGKDSPQPQLSMVIVTVAHVAVGAVLLAVAVLLAIQTSRYLAPQPDPAIAERAQKPGEAAA